MWGTPGLARCQYQLYGVQTLEMTTPRTAVNIPHPTTSRLQARICCSGYLILAPSFTPFHGFHEIPPILAAPSRVGASCLPILGPAASGFIAHNDGLKCAPATSLFQQSQRGFNDQAEEPTADIDRARKYVKQFGQCIEGRESNTKAASESER